MSRLRLPSLTVVALVGLSAASIGIGGTLLAVPAKPPATLAAAKATEIVTVSERENNDERQVRLQLETGGPRAVTAPRSGILTDLQCATGGTLKSGTTIATIDGSPVVAIATTKPLWRDLTTGDKGQDVRDLQTELTRLGHPTAVDGAVGAGTLKAAWSLLHANGLRPESTTAGGSIPRDSFAWLPGPEMSVRSCNANVGSAVEPHQALATLPVRLSAARLEQLPIDPIEGDRIIQLGSIRVPIGSTGIIDDPAGLEAISGTGEYATALAESETSAGVSASWVLSNPMTVTIVPPSAIFGIHDGTGCVLASDARRSPVKVTVVGSELGQAFIRTMNGTKLASLVSNPPRTQKCR